EFVVPGRDVPSAALHRARTVTRRAERRVLTMAETVPVRPELITYLNRLSDTLYALARLTEHQHDVVTIEQVVRRSVGKALGGGAATATAGRYDLAALKSMAEAAEAKAAELGVPVDFAGVDAGGNLMLLHRMGDSLLGSIDLAIGKAFTSAAFKLPTSALKDPSGPTGELHGIQGSNGGRVVVFGGGLPVFVDGHLAGGIGVSGGTVDQDVLIVTYALSKVQEAR
ncbi:MAG: ATP:cob(I)alamin adenosyltransferase, partial [Actinobacteria bacterium]|nr:ATP:cob(I)alamin adenosyltransferase [Actinomycetota bacterium]